jgi:hypothetical protein
METSRRESKTTHSDVWEVETVHSEVQEVLRQAIKECCKEAQAGVSLVQVICVYETICNSVSGWYQEFVDMISR